ncbi:MAG: phosphotransferase, partial [Oscillochloris sp.]|nr:phosphotransferase [Oscillochloris sp.]
MDYRYLNHYIPPSSEGLSEAWKRVMGRLGDYTQLIVRSLNLRPTAVNLLGQTDVHLLVRLTTPATHLVLRIAPEDDMAAYVYFVRSASGQRIPAAQIIQRDLSRTLVPFAYSLESYVAGAPASTICEPHLLRGAARQAGRALRRLHRQGVPGFGAPNPAGRWPATRWPDVLRRIGHRLAPPPTDQLLFNED